MKRKRISTIVAVVLIITLLSGFLVIPGSANIIVYPPVDRVSDPATDARLTTPAPPLNYGEQMGFIDIPRVHDGRIWTDKTVRNGSDTDDFDITLSALSQSFPLTSGYAIPTDTVFVIDVSGSMRTTDAGGGRMRIDVLIEALNGAIEILQDAHPQNRIAVVAYGGGIDGSGLARVERLLPLDRYTAAAGSNEYFSFLPTPAISRHHLQVNALQADVGANITSGTVLVNASTPTQWGIYEGSRVLETAAPKTAVVPRTDASGAFIENITVTRRPNIVLMTDGEPTMGWSNYLFDDTLTPANPVPLGPAGGLIYSDSYASGFTAPGVYYGDGSWGELGVSLLTVLTAAHRKRLVHNNYFGSDTVGIAPPGYAGQPPSSVGFFSIAFGTQPPGDADLLIKATMNPGAGAVNADAIRSDTRYRMSDLISSPNGPPGPIGTYNPPAGGNNTFKMNPNIPPGWSPPPPPPAPNPLPTPPPTPQPPGFNGNMGELLRQFANNVPIQFHVSRRQAFGTYIWDTAPLSINNSRSLTIDEINFADLFAEPTNLDELNDVFRQITTSIQMQGIQDTVTNVPGPGPDRSFAGYLSFSDVLGEYMQVRSVGGLTYNNTTFSRADFATAVANDATQRSEYVNILWHHMNYGTPTTSPVWLSEATVASFVASNIANADFLRNNSLKYYANTNRDFVGSFFMADGTPAPQPATAAAIVEVFPMWGTMNVAPAPPSTQTDLRLITFHVITALRTASFAELYATNNVGDPMTRVLNAGDQMIRWYIPSDLIPIRTPLFYDTANPPPSTAEIGDLRAVSGNIHPIRIDFTVGLDRNRVTGDIPPDVFAQYQVPGTTDQMYFYSNRHNPNPTNVTLAFFEPHPDNPFYRGVGGTDMRGVIKAENRTGTAPHVSSNRLVAYTAETNYDMHWLGNNGRLTFRLTEPPTQPQPADLTIAKTFTGIPSDIDVFNTSIVSQISFLVVGYNAAGAEIFRQTVFFNSENFRWNDATRSYECTLRNVPLGNYRIYERGGNILGYTLNRPGPPQTVSITTTGQTVRVPFVNNYTPSPVPPEERPAMTIWKVFHGLTNAQIPAGFQIRITGPEGFNQTINRDQAIAGVTYKNLALGQYTVTETGSSVSGFNMSFTINNRTVSLPFTFNIANANQFIGINIDNYYSPVRPPSPQTGTGSYILPVAIFLLGATIIGIAEVYRRKNKKNSID
ncbi:MAG: VWA domain-containing protein [Oscillospiraceae bacterium]|nr:VWA domain-containing protein [Oscillospiraceae bacterium]